MVPLRGDFKMCKNWNMSEKTVPILFVGDGFLSLCITSYLPFRPTLLGDFPACCGRRNASPTPLQIENLAENSVLILFVGDGFPVPLHIGLFTASPNPFGRFFRLLREAKRLPYAPTNSNLSFCWGKSGLSPGSPKGRGEKAGIHPDLAVTAHFKLPA